MDRAGKDFVLYDSRGEFHCTYLGINRRRLPTAYSFAVVDHSPHRARFVHLPVSRRAADARDRNKEGEVIEIHVDTPLEECERRDPKGLYRKARSGEIIDFTGIDSDYVSHEKPEIVLKSMEHSPAELSDQVLAYLEEHGYI